MKKVNIFLKKLHAKAILAILIILVFNISCAIVDFKTPDTQYPLEIKKGVGNFKAAIASLPGAYGIVPDTANFSEYPLGNIIKKTTTNNYEFFVFNNAYAYIVLQHDAGGTQTMYYAKIRTGAFYSRLMFEYNQLKAGLNGDDKSRTTVSDYGNWFKDAGGNYKMAIVFSPSDIYVSHYSGSGQRRIKELWKYMDAAQKAYFFEENFKFADKLKMDFESDVAASKTRKIWTYNNTTGASTPPELITQIAVTREIKFTFLYALNLTMNDNLLESGESIQYVDVDERTRDTVALFSIPCGIGDNGPMDPGTHGENGVVIILRGPDVSKTINYLKTELFGPATINITLSRNDPHLNINWGFTANVDITVERSLDSSSWTTVDTQTDYTGTDYDYAAGGGGYYYRVTVTNRDSGNSDTKTTLMAADPSPGDIIFTEVMWMGTNHDGTDEGNDEWFEIKNVSSKIIRMNNVDYYDDGTKKNDISGFNNETLIPGEYMLALNDTGHLFGVYSLSGIKYVVDAGDINFANTGDTLELRVGATVIDTCNPSGGWDAGEDSSPPNKSMVLNSSGTWITSTNDVGAAGGAYAGETFCSPGYGATGEK